MGLGVLRGSLLPSARSARAVGLLKFFPSFLLGAGGPPPLTLRTSAVRGPWLGLGAATGRSWQ